MRRILALLVLCLAFAHGALAKTAREMFSDLSRFNDKGLELLDGLSYEQGSVSLAEIGVKLNIPDSFYFLNNTDANRVLTEGWGNPLGQTQDVVGMIFPKRFTPLDEANWGAALIFQDDGHIDDAGAADLDAETLMAEMRANMREANDLRQKNGFDTASIVGWLALPTYDRRAHKLAWAREIAFSSKPETTLNYSVRFLGRTGLLSVTFVGKKRQLTEIRAAIPSVLTMAEFVPGARYEDFNPAIDKKADYGLSQLITGASEAPKSGSDGILIWAQRLFMIVLGLVGIGGGLLSWSLKRRREQASKHHRH